MNLKPLSNALKGFSHTTTTAEILLQSDRLIFKLECGHDVTKTHAFTYEDVDGENRALFSIEKSRNSMNISSKSIQSLLSHFQASFVNDIILEFKRYSFIVQSTSSLNVSTNINVDIQEFDTYMIECDTALAISLKDLKNCLVFSQSLSLPITCHFSSPGIQEYLHTGEPFIISCSPDEVF